MIKGPLKQSESIPRGNTQKGVNATVFRVLMDYLAAQAKPSLQILDIPSGRGEFAQFLKRQFPHLTITCVDQFAEITLKDIAFVKMNAHHFVATPATTSYDVVMCISGVMCFDGASLFIENVSRKMHERSLFIITNDNIVTIRDRLNFLFFGHFKRFALLNKPLEANWNVVLPQGLQMLLQRNHFSDIRVHYCALYLEDLLFFPLAIIIYPLFLMNLLLKKSHLSIMERLNLFPFTSLFCRHYVVTAVKTSA